MQQQTQTQTQNMEQTQNPNPKPATMKPLFKKRETKLQTIYSRCLITRNILLPITSIGKNIHEVLEKYVNSYFAGKCLVEGYVKPESIRIVTYSSGLIQNGDKVSFQVVFECEVCFLVEGMLIQCKAINITKAGIRAESATESPSPIVVFVARDHNYSNPQFAGIQEDDKFTAKVIGQRFELNDKYISVIAELVFSKQIPGSNPNYKGKNPRLTTTTINK